MSLRKLYLGLSLFSNFLLIASTGIAWVVHSDDAGIIVGAFALTALSISNAVLSLHFRDEKDDEK